VKYVAKVLQPGETLVYETHVSWVSYVPGLLVFFLAALVFIAGGEIFAWSLWTAIVAAVILTLALWLLFSAWFHRWTTEIAITNRRIIHKSGFIRRDTIEMSVEKVESVDVNQSLLGRLLDYGDIVVRGTGAGLAPFREIDAPLTFRSKLIGTSHNLSKATPKPDQD
jgi:uncharacterized membrane protein YdbT with pleckstrin-like domain